MNTFVKCPNCGNIAPKIEDVMFCSRCAMESNDDLKRIVRKQYQMRDIRA